LATCFYRYALQLLTPASIIAKMSGRNQIDVQDIGEMNSLFLDAKRSAGVLLEQEGKGAWATYGRR
jgi:RuvB-like protein 1 (pontin 52)